MNTTTHITPAPSIFLTGESALLRSFDAGQFEHKGKSLNYRLFSPDLSEATDEKYPLVVWLHGISGRGNDNIGQLDANDNKYAPAYFTSQSIQRENPCYVLAPQCPDGKLWVKFPSGNSTKHLRMVVRMIRSMVALHNIDPTRIYVVGQSMGGFAAWALMTEYPGIFAAGIPVSGGSIVKKVKSVVSIPVWIFHGSKDPIVPVKRSRELMEAIRGKHSENRFTEYSGGKHDIISRVFREEEMEEWIFSQMNENPTILNWRKVREEKKKEKNILFRFFF